MGGAAAREKVVSPPPRKLYADCCNSIGDMPIPIITVPRVIIIRIALNVNCLFIRLVEELDYKRKASWRSPKIRLSDVRNDQILLMFIGRMSGKSDPYRLTELMNTVKVYEGELQSFLNSMEDYPRDKTNNDVNISGLIHGRLSS
jgi:hypothetical protein